MHIPNCGSNTNESDEAGNGGRNSTENEEDETGRKRLNVNKRNLQNWWIDVLLLGKQIFSSWQRLVCDVGRATIINTTVINYRN